MCFLQNQQALVNKSKKVTVLVFLSIVIEGV